MNKELALEMRGNLRLIIEGYESFLFSEVRSGEKSVVATEALVTRDVVRTIGMSEVSEKRAQRVLNKNQPQEENTVGTPNIETKNSELAAELGVIGSAAQPLSPDERVGDNLFRNLSDCIPCNQNWDFGSFDFSRLAAILTSDIKSRFRWILDIEDMLNQNDIILRLCGFLRAFKDLCPQSILVLIAMLTAYLTKTLASIKFNFDSALKDILSMILRPYIGGLEDFLNVYIQFLVDQIDCILNVIQVSSEQLRDLDIDIEIGERETLTPEQSKNNDRVEYQFKQDIITGKGDEILNDTAEGTKRVREFLRHDTAEYIHKVTDSVSDYIEGLARDVLDWTEAEVQKVQDIVIDFLGGEWLVGSQNLSWVRQMRSVSTLIQLMKVIVNLGNVDDLCSKDNIQRVIDQFNDRQPDDIAIIEFAGEVNSPSGASASSDLLEDVSVVPSTGGSSGTPPTGSNGGTHRRRYSLSIASCLKESDNSLINKWIQELS